MSLIIAGPRASGRTTALKEWALQDRTNRAILVGNQHLASFWRNLPVQIFSVGQENLRGTSLELGIDNADVILAGLLGLSSARVGAMVVEGGIERIDVQAAIRELREIREGTR